MKPTELKLGEFYQVYDDGMCVWYTDYEFIGYDVNESEYVFRAIESPMSMSFGFFRIDKTFLETLVRPNSTKFINVEDLELGKMYSIFNPVENEWEPNYECLGFDDTTRQHMFRTFDGSKFYFVGISGYDIETVVKPNE